MARQLGKLLTVRHVPQANRLVPAAGREDLAIRAEGHAPGIPLVPREDTSRRWKLSRSVLFQIPEADLAAVPSRGQPAPVRAEGDTPDRSGLILIRRSVQVRKSVVARQCVVSAQAWLRWNTVHQIDRAAVFAEEADHVAARPRHLERGRGVARLDVPAREDA